MQMIPTKSYLLVNFLKLSINKIASKFPNSLFAPSILGSTVSAITREKDGRVYANSDKRKAGGVAGF